jgi:hypothetical protein
MTQSLKNDVEKAGISNVGETNVIRHFDPRQREEHPSTIFARQFFRAKEFALN